MYLSKRQINYFVSITGKMDIHSLYEGGYLNQEQVRNQLIREEFYKLRQSMRSKEAVEKLANDYQLSTSMVNKIIADK